MRSTGEALPRGEASGRRREGAPGCIGELVERIRHAAHAVTDGDVEAARREGRDDDALYELTVATALGQSRQRLAAVLQALKRGT